MRWDSESTVTFETPTPLFAIAGRIWTIASMADCSSKRVINQIPMTNGDWVSTTRLGVLKLAGLRARCSTGRTSFTTVVDGMSLNRAEWTWLSRTGEGRCHYLQRTHLPPVV